MRIAALWNPKAGLWLEGRKDIWEKISALQKKGPKKLIWMHCASLGEFEQGRPVIERLKQLYPGHRIALTFFSPSGYEVEKNDPLADEVLYLPPDSRANARQFIHLMRPEIVLWVKYDYWFYYLDELKQQNIPVLLLSAVFLPRQPFFKWYGQLHRRMLGCFEQLFVQTESSRHLLSAIGITRVSVNGDTRFDRVVTIAEQFRPISSIDIFCGENKVIVAGSTWEEDEEELDHYANAHPEIKFIIAPHEVDEAHLRDMENLFRESIRFSVMEKKMKEGQWPAGKTNGDMSTKNSLGAQPNVLIIDNVGMLSRLYRYAHIAYVGGGFGDDGVHNVLEAAVYGRPVVFGPVIDKYVEAMELVETGGGIVIDSALEAEAVFKRLFSDEEEYRFSSEASARYVYSKRGATEGIVRFIQENRLLTI